jgi:predicted  nucleic acid-binding Zn-ribbon protein
MPSCFYLTDKVSVTIRGMSQTDHLYRLQLLDDEIRQAKERLSEVLRLQEGNPAFIAARERAEVTKTEFQRSRNIQTDLNLELGTLNTKSKRSEDRLYSGMVKNPKELADIQQEIEALGRRRSILEDEVLEAMILLDIAEAANEITTTELLEVEEKWREDQVSLQMEQAELVARLGEMLASRKQQLTAITPQSLKAYQGAQRHAGPAAVVLMVNGRCRGCQVTLPVMLAKWVNEGQLVTCDSCGRLLSPG